MPHSKKTLDLSISAADRCSFAVRLLSYCVATVTITAAGGLSTGFARSMSGAVPAGVRGITARTTIRSAGIRAGSSARTEKNSKRTGSVSFNAATDSPRLLDLPSLSQATRYVFAPATRTVTPKAVADFTATNYDFVTAGSLDPSVVLASRSPRNSGPSASEAVHDFLSGPDATRARVAGAAVEESGPGEPGAYFSVNLHVPAAGLVRIRVEEAASTNADYWVLIDGAYVYHRVPQALQQGLASESGPQFKGIVHYTFAVPHSILAKAPYAGRGRMIQVEFQNSASEPGDGARIARIWAIGPPRAASKAASAYGGTVSNPRGAWTKQGMFLDASTYARPFAILDFRREVGGKVSFDVSGVSRPLTVGLAFSDSYEYMTSVSDSACGTTGVCTETHYLRVLPGQRTVTDPDLRGGFRYLMIFLDTPGSMTISNLHVNFTADPGVKHPARYRGAFLSASRLWNSIWYAGAYTVEMATIDPNTGRPFPATPGLLTFHAKIARGPTVIVDASKRDRLDWIGNQPLSDVAALLSNPGRRTSGTGEAFAAENSFAFAASHQFADGEIPGVYLPGAKNPPTFPNPKGFLIHYGSDGIRGVLDWWYTYLYTGDRTFLNKWWPAVQRDLAWAHGMLQPDGLISIPAAEGGTWGYDLGGEGSYFNANYVLALEAASQAARVEGDSKRAVIYAHQAHSVAAAFNAHLWNNAFRAYQVSTTDTAIPQDGNADALFAGIASKRRAHSVIKYLNTQMETRYGTETINQPHNVVQQYVDPGETFYQIAGELQQNTQASTNLAMALFSRLYGYMLRSPLGTGSTLWEGVSLNGNPVFGSYTSLAHCFSCGVVGVLSNYVLGVRPTTGGLATFSVLPHPPSALPWAEGRIPGGDGAVEAAWRRSPNGGIFALEVIAPRGDTYTAGVPVSTRNVSVWNNGRLVWQDGTAEDGSNAMEQFGYVTLPALRGDSILTEEACKGRCPARMPHRFGAAPTVPPPLPVPKPGNPQTAGTSRVIKSSQSRTPSAPRDAASVLPPTIASPYILAPRNPTLAPVSLYKVLLRGRSVTNAKGLIHRLCALPRAARAL